MKITIVLVSILAAAATWWWNMRSGRNIRAPGFAQMLKNILKCLVTGAVVYFVLLACALAYLMVTTP